MLIVNDICFCWNDIHVYGSVILNVFEKYFATIIVLLCTRIRAILGMEQISAYC